MAHLAVPLPDWSSFDPLAAVLTGVAGVLMLGLRFGFVLTMTISAALALCWRLLL